MSAYWPFIVIGIFSGSIYGLAAMGIVLTYKTTGVFNFAYGAVAMFCAFAYWQLHDSWHLTAWISLPLLLLVVAPLIGLLFEALFRPLAGLSAEVPIIVSIALLGLLQVVAVVIWGGTERGLEPIFPASTFLLGWHLHVGYDQLGTVLVSLAMGGGLWLLLRHTRFGTATRAVVDNRDLASIIGVNGNNVGRAAWVISSVFAGLVGVLLSPSQGLYTQTLPLLVIAAFTPAVIGRLVSLPWAFVGALAMGVFMSVLGKWSNSGTLSIIEASIPYLILFVALVVLGGRLKEPGLGMRPMTYTSANSAAPGPSALKGGPRRTNRSTVLGFVIFTVVALLPLAVPGPKLFALTSGAIFIVIAVTLVVLTGWAGQISLAQFGFVGIGAFTVGHLAGVHGQHFLFATLVGMAIALPLGLLVGLSSLRLSGLYLALATFAFALIVDTVVSGSAWVSGGIGGMADPRPRIFGISFASNAAMYELAVVVLAVVLLGAFLLRRGPIGRRLLILRDSPMAASTLGVNLTVTKLVAFAACGVVAALGGALYGGNVQSITPLDFTWGVSLQLLVLVVLGGRSVLTGAVIAGVIYTISTGQLFPISADAANYIQLAAILGVIGLGQNPEGTVALSVEHARRAMTARQRRRGIWTHGSADHRGEPPEQGTPGWHSRSPDDFLQAFWDGRAWTEWRRWGDRDWVRTSSPGPSFAGGSSSPRDRT